ncbi:MAG: sigma-70 family RNA polymerase sigma factor [Bacteroidia bacterium]
METPFKDEKVLIKACIKEHRKAQRYLYDSYRVAMFRVCLRYAPSKEVAEDLLQEGFYSVFKDIHQFRGDGALGGWIHKVMVRTALTYLRKNAKNIWQEDLNIDHQYDGESYIIADLGASHIMRLLQTLPPGYRAIFNLYAIEGYSHQEIGELLNITESTSRSQYVRARQFLQKMLQKESIS